MPPRLMFTCLRPLLMVISETIQPTRKAYIGPQYRALAMGSHGIENQLADTHGQQQGDGTAQNRREEPAGDDFAHHIPLHRINAQCRDTRSAYGANDRMAGGHWPPAHAGPASTRCLLPSKAPIMAKTRSCGTGSKSLPSMMPVEIVSRHFSTGQIGPEKLHYCRQGERVPDVYRPRTNRGAHGTGNAVGTRFPRSYRGRRQRLGHRKGFDAAR
jgi:hypothetical protein